MRTIRLLIVEDNLTYLFLIKKAFTEHRAAFRWDLMIATDGEQALRLLFAEDKGGAPAAVENTAPPQGSAVGIGGYSSAD